MSSRFSLGCLCLSQSAKVVRLVHLAIDVGTDLFYFFSFCSPTDRILPLLPAVPPVPLHRLPYTVPVLVSPNTPSPGTAVPQIWGGGDAAPR